MPDKNIQSATMKLGRMKTKKAWLGMYFNHYNAVVVFNKKPKYTNDVHSHLEGKWIDLIDDYNKTILAGCTSLDEFKMLFPDINLKSLLNEHGNAKNLEPVELIEVRLTAFWEKDNTLVNVDFSLDGYQS